VGQGIDDDFVKLQDVFSSAQPGETIHLQGIFQLNDHTLRVEKSLTIVGDVINAVKPMFQGGGTTTVDSVGKPIALPALDVVAGDGSVTIQGVDFISPRVIAIRVAEAGGLMISGCRIVGLQPLKVGNLDTATGIIVGNLDGARKVFGKLIVSNNHIDAIGSSSQNTLGINFNRAGIDLRFRATISVEQNTVTNVTAIGLDFRDLMGEATINGNMIDMGAVGVNTPGFLISGIRCLGTSQLEPAEGVYTVANNHVRCQLETAAGIRLVSSSSVVPLNASTVVDNEITMLTPVGADTLNAGIEIRGNNTKANLSDNTILGHARAAISLIKFAPASKFAPATTTLLGYFRQQFNPAEADIVLDTGVSNTTIIGPNVRAPGTIRDFGSTNPSIEGNYEVLP